ncbi:MAG: PEP-CTERM sorting domain-containing protein [Proteobacteria bacterium]|jgi:hypothetical protein|nr:PEP-CTERM sorting domain-containing protein [Pseudomonadota bacterium]
MNTQTKLLVTALFFTGSISTASASADISNITASGLGLGTFSWSLSGSNLTIDKTFNSVNPIDLEFTVVHGTGAPGINVTEHITNNTGIDWTDFHFIISGHSGVVFTDFSHSTLSGFTLEHAPISGPTNLNYLGALANGGISDGLFNLSMPDPGVGSSYTFHLTQVPTIPEPETYAMFLIGLGLLGVTMRRRK